MNGLNDIVADEISINLSLTPTDNESLHIAIVHAMTSTFEKTTIMDSADQMKELASSAMPVIVNFFKAPAQEAALATSTPTIDHLWSFQTNFAKRATELHASLRREYLTGVRGSTPASAYMGLTKAIYEYIRKDLGVKMHGDENFALFPNGIGKDNVSIGQNISKIYEAIRDGKFRSTVISLFLLWDSDG